MLRAHDRIRASVALTGIKPTGTQGRSDAGRRGAPRQLLRRDPARAAPDRALRLRSTSSPTTTRSRRSATPARCASNVHDIAATWLACGLDPERALLFRQSDVIEVFELAWVFACMIATGQLERGHAYKDALDARRGAERRHLQLPAADGRRHHPVRHRTSCRSARTRSSTSSSRATSRCASTTTTARARVVVPEALITEAPLVPGLDGRKMSKSYGNTHPAVRAAARRCATRS